MRVTNDDIKPSLEDALEHFGVKGMKWGVRRSQAELARAKGNPGSNVVGKKGEERTQAIKKARIANQFREKEHDRAVREFIANGDPKKSAALQKKMLVTYDELVKNPDFVDAGYMTKGEKAALTALAVVIPGGGTAGSIGVSAGMVVDRRARAKERRKSLAIAPKSERKKYGLDD